MANVFLSLPVPAGNGSGAAVNTSALGRVRTLTIDGEFESVLTLEIANDAAGTEFVPFVSTTNPGTTTFSVAARWMRITQTNFQLGSATAGVGSNDDGTACVSIPVPAGEGVGASVSVAALGTFNTCVVTGDFTGSISLECSSDGVEFLDLLSFQQSETKSTVVVCQFMRARRRRVGVVAGTPVMEVCAVNDAGTGSGGTAASIIGLNNIEDFGAVCDGVTDDRAAVQAAWDDAVTNGLAGILHPGKGPCAMTRSASIFASIDINGDSDLGVYGNGDASEFRMIGSGSNSDWYMFRIRNASSRIKFKNVHLNGNQGALTDLDEQTHLVNLTGDTGLTREIEFDNCLFNDVFGDGVRMVGAVGFEVEVIAIRNSRFLDNGRSGVGVQRATRRIQINNNYFEGISDQDIDFEPTGAGEVAEYTICENTTVRTNASPISMTLTGVGGSDLHRRSRVSQNIIIDAAINGLNIERVSIVDNYVGGSLATNTRTIDLFRALDDVEIADNTIVYPAAAPTGQAVGIAHNAGISPNRIKIVDNHIIQEGDGTPVSCESLVDSQICNNIIDWQGTTTNVQFGIVVRATIRDIFGITTNGNTILGAAAAGPGQLAAGISFSASPFDIEQIQCSNNTVRNADDGVHFAAGGGAYNDMPVVIGNTFDVATSGVPAGAVGLLNLRGVIIGGQGVAGTTAQTPGARYIAMGLGDPNVGGGAGAVAGSIGCQFLRRDGGAGTTLYIKESGGDDTTGGWVAK